MIIQCKQCQTSYRIDESKISDRGAHVTCKKCQEKIIVKQPDPAESQSETRSGTRVESLLERIATALETLAELAQAQQSLDAHHAEQMHHESKADIPETNTSHQRYDLIKQYLETRSIQIRRLPEEDASDELINSLALYLGESYELLEKLYKMIKRTMQKGESFSLRIANETQKAISVMCQFCHRLHQAAFLMEYKYFKSPQFLITARSSTLPHVQNFFSGQWLERYILQKMSDIVERVANRHSTHFKWSYLINPQIKLPNEDDFELDILFEVEEKMYWVEAKTGDYQSYIDKYSKMTKILEIDNYHAFMVLTSIDESICDSLSAMFSMKVCSINVFMESFEQILTQDLVG